MNTPLVVAWSAFVVTGGGLVYGMVRTQRDHPVVSEASGVVPVVREQRATTRTNAEASDLFVRAGETYLTNTRDRGTEVAQLADETFELDQHSTGLSGRTAATARTAGRNFGRAIAANNTMARAAPASRIQMGAGVQCSQGWCWDISAPQVRWPQGNPNFTLPRGR